MNLSGVVVNQIVTKYEIDTKNLLIISDDINLKLGKIRIRESGSAGGHNGLKSIIQELGTTDFKRLRIGIQNKTNIDPEDKNSNLQDFVLSEFTKEEQDILQKPIQQSMELITHFLFQDYKKMLDEFSKLNYELIP